MLRRLAWLCFGSLVTSAWAVDPVPPTWTYFGADAAGPQSTGAAAGQSVCTATGTTSTWVFNDGSANGVYGANTGCVIFHGSGSQGSIGGCSARIVPISGIVTWKSDSSSSR